MPAIQLTLLRECLSRSTTSSLQELCKCLDRAISLCKHIEALYGRFEVLCAELTDLTKSTAVGLDMTIPNHRDKLADLVREGGGTALEHDIARLSEELAATVDDRDKIWSDWTGRIKTANRGIGAAVAETRLLVAYGTTTDVWSLKVPEPSAVDSRTVPFPESNESVPEI